MQNINFDDGFKEFTINGDENRIVRFNPSDFGILDRVENTVAAFEEIERALKESNQDSIAEVLNEIDKKIKQQINYIFNSDIADIIFNGQSPMSLVKGEFLFMRVIEAIVPIIKKAVEKEQRESEKRISKYMEAYK